MLAREISDGPRHVLEGVSGFRVVGEAGSLRGGLTLAVRHQPDLLITELRLPDGPGSRFCELMLDTLPQLKVVILTLRTTASRHSLQEERLSPKGPLVA